MTLLLPLLIAVPLVVAGLVAAIHLPRTVRVTILSITLTVLVVMACALLWATAQGQVPTMQVGGWQHGISIPIQADAFTAIMLVLMLGLALAVVPFAHRTGAAGEPFFVPLVLLLMAGVNLALLTRDLFTLFVGIEVMLLPSYALMILAHRGQGLRMQVSATRIYVSVNLLTSSILLIGIAVLYASVGGVAFSSLLGRGDQSTTARAGTALVLFALCVKAAVVPMHGWLGRTYPHMSPTMTALFSGLHTKIAVYGIFRMHSVMFGGDDTWTHFGLALFTISMVVGALPPLGATHARANLSMGMVSQIGYILLGLAIHTPAGIAAGIFYLVHNVVAKAALLLCAGAVETAYGRHRLGEVSGLLRRERLTALAFFAAAMSMAGLPPMSGFVAKVALIVSAFRAEHWWVGGFALGVSLFTLMAMLRIWGHMFLGEPTAAQLESDDGKPRIGWSLAAPGLVLAMLSLALGLGAEPLLQVSRLAADQLLNPAHLAVAR